MQQLEFRKALSERVGSSATRLRLSMVADAAGEVDATASAAVGSAEASAEANAEASTAVSQASAANAIDHTSTSGAAPPSNSSDAECVMCLDGNATHILAPCGHQCICAECVASFKLHVDLCPLCRTVVDSVVGRVFR